MQRSFDDLYGGEPPHQRHSDTSTDAASELPEERRASLRAKVMAYIAMHPQGATDEEMQFALDMEGNTERPRRRELQLGGLIVDSGSRRLTVNRRRAVVWVRRPPEEEQHG